MVDDAGRPVGVVDEAACPGVDRFTRLADVLDPAPLTLAGRTPRRARCSTAARPDARVALGRRRRRPARRRAHRARARCAPAIYTPAVDAAGRLRVAAAVGINGDVAVKAKALLDAGVDVLVVDTAHGHQEKMLDALRAVRSVVGATPSRSSPATSSPPRARAT